LDIKLKPCGRCERELPPASYDHEDAMFCKQCTREISKILSQKYNAIEAAVIRAKLRRGVKNRLPRAKH
jgi:hypothetical protein